MAIGDIHYNEEIPLEPTFKFADKYKPHILLLAGDIYGYHIISHHEKENFRLIGFNNMKEAFWEDVALMRKKFRKLREAFPYSHIIWMIGNHEVWPAKYNRLFPQLKALDIPTLLEGDGDGIEFIPQFGTLHIGHASFEHGENIGSIKYKAAKAVEDAKETIFFWHHHTHQTFSTVSRTDDEKAYVGAAVPCMTRRDPQYSHNRRNAVCQGWLTFNVKMPSGKFSFNIQRVSPNGNFIDQYGREWL